MLEEALVAEVEQFVESHRELRASDGKQRVVRNGYLPSRTVLTGAGPLEVRRPRVRDKEAGQEEPIKFTSQILPPYLRRSQSLDELIPWLYLKGISTGDFGEALQALLGPAAKGLSANVVVNSRTFGARSSRRGDAASSGTRSSSTSGRTASTSTFASIPTIGSASSS